MCVSLCRLPGAAMASAIDRDQLLAQVKRDVRSLLISAKSGLAIEDLYRDYKLLVFSPLPFKELGFKSARAFLQSIPDVCQCQLLPGDNCLLTAVADNSTAHIQKMVERQKPSQKRGATARVLASRYVRRSTPARTSSYRQQPSPAHQAWHQSPAPARREATPEPRPQPLLGAAPQPLMGAAPQPQLERPASRGSPEAVPARVAGRLAQVLLSRPDGVAADRLPALYNSAAPDGEPFDWAGRGYRSCAEMLLQVPHIARVVNSWSGLRVYPSRALIGECFTRSAPSHAKCTFAAADDCCKGVRHLKRCTSCVYVHRLNQLLSI